MILAALDKPTDNCKKRGKTETKKTIKELDISEIKEKGYVCVHAGLYLSALQLQHGVCPPGVCLAGQRASTSGTLCSSPSESH